MWWKSRKFVVVLAALATSFVLALMGRLTTEYATVVSVVTAAFHTADTLITRKSMDPK